MWQWVCIKQFNETKKKGVLLLHTKTSLSSLLLIPTVFLKVSKDDMRRQMFLQGWNIISRSEILCFSSCKIFLSRPRTSFTAACFKCCYKNISHQKEEDVYVGFLTQVNLTPSQLLSLLGLDLKQTRGGWNLG